MILGIDHLAIAVLDPDAAISELASALGMSAGASGGRHQAWGTRNRLLWLGDTYVELCTVFDPHLAEGSWLGRPTLRALQQGPTAIGWAISSDDLDLDRAEMNAAGGALGPPISGERRRPDGQVVRWRLALPPEVGLERPFLIEHDVSAAEWTAEDRAERAAVAGRLLRLELPVDAVEGLRPGGAEVAIGSQGARLAGPDARPPTIRIGGLARAGAELSVVGCRWLLE